MSEGVFYWLGYHELEQTLEGAFCARMWIVSVSVGIPEMFLYNIPGKPVKGTRICQPAVVAQCRSSGSRWTNLCLAPGARGAACFLLLAKDSWLAERSNLELLSSCGAAHGPHGTVAIPEFGGRGNWN